MQHVGRLIAASVVMLIGSVVVQAEEFPVPTLIVETAAGANLITNGGFETGNFNGWTQGGNSGFTGILSGGGAAGTYSTYLGPIGSTGSLSQTLTTVAGVRYDLTYQLRTTGSNPNRFDVFWNGGAIASLSLQNTSINGWTTFSALNLMASGPTTTLSFVARHDPGFFYLDEVSVTSQATPEASTMALVGGALLLIGTFRRNRSQLSCQRPSASDRRT